MYEANKQVAQQTYQTSIVAIDSFKIHSNKHIATTKEATNILQLLRKQQTY